MKYNFFLLTLIAAGMAVLAGCGPQVDVSGSYSTAVDARSTEGVSVAGESRGGAHTKRSVSDRQRHPTSSDCRHDSNSDYGRFGIRRKGRVFGHAQLPLGNIALSFHGTAKDGRIGGSVNVTLHSLFGGETDRAALLLAKS
ncbi:MAG: hypothetical protein ACRD4Q_09025 [Candidatus Acidiferrales bacterium]